MVQRQVEKWPYHDSKRQFTMKTNVDCMRNMLLNRTFRFTKEVTVVRPLSGPGTPRPSNEVQRDEECHDETWEVRGTQEGVFHIHARTNVQVSEALTLALCKGDTGLGLGGLGDWGSASSPLDDGHEDDGQVGSFLHFTILFHFISFCSLSFLLCVSCHNCCRARFALVLTRHSLEKDKKKLMPVCCS